MNVFEVIVLIIIVAVGGSFAKWMTPTLGVFGWIAGLALATGLVCLILWAVHLCSKKKSIEGKRLKPPENSS